MSIYLISGGSGLIGSALRTKLEAEGHRVRILSRSPSDPEKGVFHWNIAAKESDERAFDGLDYLIQLAGSGVVSRSWTAKYKTEILESRVNSTRLLAKFLRENSVQLKAVACASAIGFYGDRLADELLNESSSAGSGFLPAVCESWEESGKAFKELGIPTATIRIGIVLARESGALPPLITMAKTLVLSPLGNGKQVTSWIHLEDLVRLFKYALDRGESAVYNGVAPNPVSNRVFTKAIARACRRPILVPFVPSFALKLILGERAEAVLMGSHVIPKEALDSGFEFKYTQVDDALDDLLS